MNNGEQEFPTVVHKAGAARPDAEKLRGSVEELLARATARGTAADVELYARSAVTIRVSRRADGTNEIVGGRERGLALRARHPGTGTGGFAATSGVDAGALERNLAAVEAAIADGAEPADPWSDSTAEERRDHDPGTPPTVEVLSAWLERALESVATPEPTRAWVEVAATAEAWIASPAAAAASRSRILAWARLEPGADASGRTGRPIQVASRGWEGLSDEGWAEILSDRWNPAADAARSDAVGRTPVLFNPECSAQLSRALVRARQAMGGDEGWPVGPGLKIADDPLAAGALFGGTFDDAGFATRRALLADGERWKPGSEAAGHRRRPSFRDPPALAPSHLVVLGRPQAPPARCILVSGQTLHVLGPASWLLEIDAAEMVDGQPGPRLRRRFLRTSPAELSGACVAAVGPPRRSYLGDASPALLFDDLEVVG